MSYWLGGVAGAAVATVCQLVKTSTPSLSVSKTSPTMRTGICRPWKASVMVSPTDFPVAARKPVGTSTWPGPVYQCPLISSYPVQLALPSKAAICTTCDMPSTVTPASISAT